MKPLQTLKRINPETGKEEFWNQPLGLPGIWMTPGYCDRCKPFNECLGLLTMDAQEWASVEDLITKTNWLLDVKEQLKEKDLKSCASL